MQKFESRGFSQISDEEGEGVQDKEGRGGSGKDDDDGGSEDCILPIQGGERLEPWVVKKEVSYSVKVEELGDEERELESELQREMTRERSFDRGERNKSPALMPKRGSRGRISALSTVSMA